MHIFLRSCIRVSSISVSVVERTETRDLILDACDVMMARYGFLKMTMDDLARASGLAKRTIYLHFASKTDVGLSSIGRVVDRAHQRMRESLDSVGPVEPRLRAMLRDRVMMRVEAVQAYHQGLDGLFAVVRPAYLERRRAAFAKETGLVAACLVKGRESGELLIEDPSITARTLLHATNAFLPYSLSVRELGSPETIASQVDAMIDLLLRGLKNGA